MTRERCSNKTGEKFKNGIFKGVLRAFFIIISRGNYRKTLFLLFGQIKKTKIICKENYRKKGVRRFCCLKKNLKLPEQIIIEKMGDFFWENLKLSVKRIIEKCFLGFSLFKNNLKLLERMIIVDCGKKLIIFVK